MNKIKSAKPFILFYFILCLRLCLCLCLCLCLSLATNHQFRWSAPLHLPQPTHIPYRHPTPFRPFRDAALRFGQIITPVRCDCVVDVVAVAGSGRGCGRDDFELIRHRKRKWCHYTCDFHALKCRSGRDIPA